MMVAFLELVANAIGKPIRDFISSSMIKHLFFKGEIGDEYRIDSSYEKIMERYKESIQDSNKALSLNISFTVIALYVYFVLPPNNSIEVPLIQLSISRELWISIAPIISYGLQIFIITAFIWLMSLRLTLKVLKEDREKSFPSLLHTIREIATPLIQNATRTAVSEAAEIDQEADKRTVFASPPAPIAARPINEFPDFTNLYLNGMIGHLWIIFRLREMVESRWNYLWYMPALLLISAIALSPLLVCIFFIVQLFMTGNPWLGVSYSIFFVPYSILFTLLVVSIGILREYT